MYTRILQNITELSAFTLKEFRTVQNAIIVYYTKTIILKHKLQIEFYQLSYVIYFTVHYFIEKLSAL